MPSHQRQKRENPKQLSPQKKQEMLQHYANNQLTTIKMILLGFCLTLIGYIFTQYPLIDVDIVYFWETFWSLSVLGGMGILWYIQRWQRTSLETLLNGNLRRVSGKILRVEVDPSDISAVLISLQLENGKELLGRCKTYKISGWVENMPLELWLDAENKYFFPNDLYLWKKLNPVGEIWSKDKQALHNMNKVQNWMNYDLS